MFDNQVTHYSIGCTNCTRNSISNEVNHTRKVLNLSIVNTDWIARIPIKDTRLNVIINVIIINKNNLTHTTHGMEKN